MTGRVIEFVNGPLQGYLHEMPMGFDVPDFVGVPDCPGWFPCSYDICFESCAKYRKNLRYWYNVDKQCMTATYWRTTVDDEDRRRS